MEWKARAQQIIEKIRCYRNDEDGWKLSKKSPEVTVWEKPSPDWNGMLYKVEGEMNAEPEMVFKYVDPRPSGPRGQFDKAIKELQLVDSIAENIFVVRTITHDAFGGLISPRDFTDLVINENNGDYLATSSEGVEHPGCVPVPEFVRGKNYPCSILCFRVPGNAKRTKVISFIQTDLSGMLPKALVETALPSNQINFFASLRKALEEDGHWCNE
jgi:hypothetical protein